MSHIGIDASRYQSSSPTGVEVYSDKLIDELQKIAGEKQIRLTLIAPSRKNIPHSPWVHQYIIPGKRLWTLGKLTWRFWRNPSLVDRLFVPSHILPLKLPSKAYVTIHDVAWKYFPESYTWFARTLLDYSTKFAVKHAEKIICVSEATRKDLIKFYSCPLEKVVTIQSGFDQESFLKMLPSSEEQEDILKKFELTSKKYFIYVGRIEEKKNIPLLIEAFLKAKLTSEWKLVLVGKPGVGYEKVLKLKEMDKEGRVLMTGYLPNDKAYSLVKHARASMLVSQYEGFGFPILEAFALQVPIIASDIPALREIGGDAPYYVHPQQINTLIQALKIFAQEKYQVDALLQKGCENLEPYSWEHSARKVFELINEGE